MGSAAVPDGENNRRGAALMVAEGPNGYLKGNQFRYNSYATISFLSREATMWVWTHSC